MGRTKRQKARAKLEKRINRSCTSKKFFQEKTEAYRVLVKCRGMGMLTPEHQVYKCDYCLGWHIGKSHFPPL